MPVLLFVSETSAKYLTLNPLRSLIDMNGEGKNTRMEEITCFSYLLTDVFKKRSVYRQINLQTSC